MRRVAMRMSIIPASQPANITMTPDITVRPASYVSMERLANPEGIRWSPGTCRLFVPHPSLLAGHLPLEVIHLGSGLLRAPAFSEDPADDGLEHASHSVAPCDLDAVAPGQLRSSQPGWTRHRDISCHPRPL